MTWFDPASRRIGERGRCAVLGHSTHTTYWRHLFQIMADALAARDRSPRSAGARNA